MKIKWYTCPVCNMKYNYYKDMMDNETPEHIAKMCLFKNDTYMKHKKINDDIIYKNIPRVKKRKFLDCMHKCKTVRESYEEADLTQEEGFVVLDYNIAQNHYLRSEPKENEDKNET